MWRWPPTAPCRTTPRSYAGWWMRSIRRRSTSGLVQDNLNAHTAAALHETFPPAEARRILQRLEFHYTPKHGSWLHMAEIEIALLERNALSRRLEDEAALRRQVEAVETERNEQRR